MVSFGYEATRRNGAAQRYGAMATERCGPGRVSAGASRGLAVVPSVAMKGGCGQVVSASHRWASGRRLKVLRPWQDKPTRCLRAGRGLVAMLWSGLGSIGIHGP